MACRCPNAMLRCSAVMCRDISSPNSRTTPIRPVDVKNTSVGLSSLLARSAEPRPPATSVSERSQHGIRDTVPRMNLLTTSPMWKLPFLSSVLRFPDLVRAKLKILQSLWQRDAVSATCVCEAKEAHICANNLPTPCSFHCDGPKRRIIPCNAL